MPRSRFTAPYRLTRLLLPFLGFILAASAAAEPLRVAISPDYMPIAFKQDGKLVGIEVDNAREVASFLGREVKFVEMTTADYIEALNAGKVDVVMSGYSVTPERKAQVDFVTPFMEVGQMAIILAEDAAQLAHPRALYREGIRIVPICPGDVDTPMLRGEFRDRGLEPRDGLRESAEGVPLNRVCSPAEVADMVLYACSDSAAFVTGYPLVLDGGNRA